MKARIEDLEKRVTQLEEANKWVLSRFKSTSSITIYNAMDITKIEENVKTINDFLSHENEGKTFSQEYENELFDIDNFYN